MIATALIQEASLTLLVSYKKMELVPNKTAKPVKICLARFV